MTFNSITFLVFFAVVSALMLITNIDLKVKKDKIIQIRHIILLLASYVYYGWWNWKCAFLMLGLTFIAYWSAKKVNKTNNKIYLSIGIVVPLVILGVFKYFNFFVDSFSSQKNRVSLQNFSISRNNYRLCTWHYFWNCYSFSIVVV